ncbi:MAG: glycosyltransferase family 4 protein [Methanomassiliicoccales archaeon]|nr:glycosyltransferase family 4 protein [Methanomassiliicoccales archaeon]
MADLKLCMLDPLFFPYVGGTEKVVLEVGSRLVRDHHCEVKVLTSMIPQANGRAVEEIKGMEVVRVPSVYFGKLPAFLPPPYTLSPSINRDMVRFCRGYDIYHFHNRFWYSPRTYRKIKQIFRAPIMLTVHNSRPKGISRGIDFWGGVFDETMGNFVFGICDRINCVSRSALEDTIPPKWRHKATVVYNGVDTGLFTPGLRTAELRQRLGVGSSPVVLSNGRLVEQKGFHTLIMAMAEVVKQVRDTHLVIIGKGPLKDRLLGEATDLGIGDRVRIVTGISEQELPVYYCMADVFALASYYEPLGVVLAEAMGCGRATVATSVGGIPEIVSGGVGLLVPPRDHIVMANALVRLLTDDELRRGMESAARSRAVEMFDWSVITREWIRSYQALQ